MAQQLIRQGDVALVPVTEIPDDATPEPREHGAAVLAWGEATGHKHQILSRDATVLTTADNQRFLRIVGSAALDLVHEEHATIPVEPGLYRLPPQVEWADDMEPQRVID